MKVVEQTGSGGSGWNAVRFQEKKRDNGCNIHSQAGKASRKGKNNIMHSLTWKRPLTVSREVTKWALRKAGVEER